MTSFTYHLQQEKQNMEFLGYFNMAPPDRYYRDATDYAVERYNREGRVNMQNGQAIVQNGPVELPILTGPEGQPLSPVHTRQILERQPPYPDIRMVGPDGLLLSIPQTRQILERAFQQQMMSPEARAEKETTNSSPKAQQNSEAITKYNKENKAGKIREGRHAAAVDQIHENHLHNIKKVKELPKDKEQKGANGQGRNGQNYLLYHELDTGQISGIQRPAVRPQQESDSELTTSFDPMKDRHMWTMWRTAVNGRIVDEVRRLEKIKTEQGPQASTQLDATAPGVYGRALVAPPLKRFIRFEDGSKQIAQRLSTVGQGQLLTSQFVYYGLPRVYVPPPRKTPELTLPEGPRPIEYPPRPTTMFD